MSEAIGLTVGTNDKPVFVPAEELAELAARFATQEDFMQWATELIRPENLSKKRRVAQVFVACLATVAKDVQQKSESAESLARWSIEEAAPL